MRSTSVFDIIFMTNYKYVNFSFKLVSEFNINSNIFKDRQQSMRPISVRSQYIEE